MVLRSCLSNTPPARSTRPRSNFPTSLSYITRSQKGKESSGEDVASEVGSDGKGSGKKWSGEAVMGDEQVPR